MPSRIVTLASSLAPQGTPTVLVICGAHRDWQDLLDSALVVDVRQALRFSVQLRLRLCIDQEAEFDRGSSFIFFFNDVLPLSRRSLRKLDSVQGAALRQRRC